jgi:hypothetical protein
MKPVAGCEPSGAPEPEPWLRRPLPDRIPPYFFVDVFVVGCSTLTAVATWVFPLSV